MILPSKMFKNRIYIIICSDLVLEIQKWSKKLPLSYIEAIFAERMPELNATAVKAILNTVHDESDQSSFFVIGMLAMHRELRPSEKLNDMTSTVVQKLAVSMTKLGTEDEASIDL